MSYKELKRELARIAPVLPSNLKKEAQDILRAYKHGRADVADLHDFQMIVDNPVPMPVEFPESQGTINLIEWSKNVERAYQRELNSYPRNPSKIYELYGDMFDTHDEND